MDHVIQTLSHKPVTFLPLVAGGNLPAAPQCAYGWARSSGDALQRSQGAWLRPGLWSVHVRKGDKWVEVRALLDNIVLYQASNFCIRFSCH